ncbi:MAG: MerR family transcriptional regulator [Alphaproteobacteria bacterium]|nr:MAG: MerR family transcriptional regulator [Alphaproteobacteria bacterium]
MVPQKDDFRIGALSRQSGVKIETIRYYERIGVMPPPPRSQSGYRLYDDSHLRRLSFIRRSRHLGFSLEEIRGLLVLVDGHAYSCAQVQALTQDHLETTRRKIADLQKLEGVLGDMVAQCDGGLVPDCPVIDILFDQKPGNQ